MKHPTAVAKANDQLATISRERDKERRIAFAFAVVAVGVLALLPEVAMAASWDRVGQKVLDFFTGGLARIIAILCVMGLGFAAMAGKLAWNWAIGIVIGIVLVFGGASIVDYLISAASN